MIDVIRFRDKNGEIQKGVLITSIYCGGEFPFRDYKFIVYHNNSLIQLFYVTEIIDLPLGLYKEYTTYDYFIEHLNCPDLDSYMDIVPEERIKNYFNE